MLALAGEVDAEAVPLAGVTVFQMVVHPPHEVGSQAHVVQTLVLVQRVDPGMALDHAAHDGAEMLTGEHVTADAFEVFADENIFSVSHFGFFTLRAWLETSSKTLPYRSI